MARSSKERLNDIDEHFKNITEEELIKLIENGEKGYKQSWLLDNQNSFYSCLYCGKDGHITLCNDLIGRCFCPECRDKAEKEFLG